MGIWEHKGMSFLGVEECLEWVDIIHNTRTGLGAVGVSDSGNLVM